MAAANTTAPCVNANMLGYGSLQSVSISDIDRQISLMKQAGIKWFRFGFFQYQIETSPGVYDFSLYDHVVDTAADNGIGMIAMLADYSVYGNSNWQTPATASQYQSFVSTVASHFKGRIAYYELGNEPDIPEFWAPEPNVVAYTQLLKVGYTAVKTADPGAKVISAGLALRNENFLKGMYTNGAKEYFDYMGFHPYSWPDSPDAGFAELARLKSVMAANGDNKQIMVTEVGWPSTTQSGGVTETTQANYIEQTFTLATNNNVPITCIYDFIDDGTDKSDPENSFGVLRTDYSKKPSFYKFQICNNSNCVSICSSQTCSSLGYECGIASDSCGKTLDCGTCQSGQTCQNGTCICIPKNCTSLGYNCGIWSNSCNGTLYCGFCNPTQICKNGQCVAKPIPSNVTVPLTCYVNQTCTIRITNCSSGLLVLRNQIGLPIDMRQMIMSGDFPITFFSRSPYTRSFIAASTGTVRTIMVCLGGQVWADRREIIIS